MVRAATSETIQTCQAKLVTVANRCMHGIIYIAMYMADVIDTGRLVEILNGPQNYY